MTIANLPTPVDSYLREFVSRQRRFALLGAGGAGLAVFLSVMLLACLVDRLLPMPPAARAAVLIADVLLFAAMLIRPLRRLLRPRTDWLEAANEIESHNPTFTQRLQTVVSQLIEDPRYRGSPQILDHLLAEITEQAIHDHPRRYVRWRSLAPTWGTAGGVALLMCALAAVPVLGMPALAARFICPLAGIAAVTTTRITVESGDIQLVRGGELTIRARAERLGGGPLELFTSQDGNTWTRLLMQSAGGNKYTASMPSLERDLSYYLKGGDAATPTYKVAVLRPPTVAEYRIRYEYPQYANIQPITVSSGDGVVEALAGTKATLSIVSPEPLKSARMIDGPAFESTADPNIRQAHLVLRDSRGFDLELASSSGLVSTLKRAVTLRVQADRKPIVRLIQPFESLRLHPRDVLPIQFYATDDYGLNALSLLVQINSAPEVTVPLRMQGDLRRQEGQFLLDLASLNVKIGDVIRLDLLVEDGAGNKSRIDDKDRRFVLVAPRSIDVNARLRIAELRQASRSANLAREELERAAESLDRSNATGLPEGDRLGERLKIGRAIARAAEAANSLHQALLRAAVRSEYPQTRILAEATDQCRMLMSAAERLGADAPGSGDQGFSDRLRASIGIARQLASHLSTLSDGAHAAGILAERQNLRTIESLASQLGDKAKPERTRAMERASRDIAAQVEDLSLSPTAADLDAQLQRRVEAATGLVGNSKWLDFEGPAAEWAAAVRRGDPQPPPLPERLLSAASIEALRPDADPVRARDFQLAARAAQRLMPLAIQEEKTVAETARAATADFPRVISTLQRDHRLNRRPGNVRAEGAADIRSSATAARAHLADWAAQTDAALATQPQADVESEDLAFQASAEVSRHAYALAVALDQRLARRVRLDAFDDSAAVHQIKLAMDSLQAIDQLLARQGELRRVASAAAPDAARLAQDQLRLSQEIARIESADRQIVQAPSASADSRQLGVAAMQQAIDQVSRMPQQLAAAISAIQSQRQLAGKLADANQALASAKPEAKAAAQQAVEQVQRDLKKSADQLAALAGVLSPQAAQRLSAQVRVFEPESRDAAEAIAQQLASSLTPMQQAIKANDPAAVERAAQPVRDAAARAQQLLAEAQLRLIDQEALTAAHWLTQAAAQSLGANPPDLPRARAFQESAATALNRAWHDASRDAAIARLAVTPTFRIVLGAAPPDPAGRSASSIGELPGVRQWAPLRQHLSPAAPARESDAPTYLEALRLYFEGIYKAREQSGK